MNRFDSIKDIGKACLLATALIRFNGDLSGELRDIYSAPESLKTKITIYNSNIPDNQINYVADVEITRGDKG